MAHPRPNSALLTARRGVAGLGISVLLLGCGHSSVGVGSSTSTAVPAPKPPQSPAPVATAVNTTLAPTSAAPTTEPAAPTTTTPATTTASATVVDCQGDAPTARPTTLILACGDGGALVRAITWATWGATTSTGQGQYAVNTCTPDCVQGTFDFDEADVTLSSLTVSAGGTFYRSLTVTPLPPNSDHLTGGSFELPGL